MDAGGERDGHRAFSRTTPADALDRQADPLQSFAVTARDRVSELLRRHYRDQPDEHRADVAVLDAMYHGDVDRWSLRQALDELIAGAPGDLRELVREHAGRDLPGDEAVLAFLERVRMLVFTSYRPSIPLPADADVLRACEATARALQDRLVAFEARWDGDTSGWWVELWAVERLPDGHREHRLRSLSGPGGDIRLFHGAVPPWPEAALAHRLGTTLAAQFAVPFHFPAPDDPDDSAPTWLDVQDARDRGVCIDHGGRTFLAREDPEAHFFDVPGRMLEVFSEDCRFHVYYPMGQADRPERRLVIAGREFPGLADPRWKRIATPRWDDDGAPTPAFTRKLVAWCLSPDRGDA